MGVYAAIFLETSNAVEENAFIRPAPEQPISEPIAVTENETLDDTERETEDNCPWYKFWCSVPDAVGGAISAVGDFFTAIWSGIVTAYTWLSGIFNVVWGFLTFFWGFLSFNIPGAPVWIRIPVGTGITGSLGWSIATLVRGGS